MPTFKYVARSESGTLVEGNVSAATAIEAARQVRAEGKFVVKVEADSGRKSASTGGGAIGVGTVAKSPARRSRQKLKPDDLIFFTNQLAVMAETGVSLAEALDACVHDGNSPGFASALNDVIDQVRGGSEFSAALANHPRVFPTIYVNLVKASEASGTLGVTLRRLADYLQDQRAMIKKIKGAVTYPIVMFVFAIGVTIFLLTFVLPKFSTIYAGREDKLPALTKYLLAFSGELLAYGLYVGVGLVLAIGGAVWYLRTPRGRVTAETLRLRTPLIGPLFEKTYLARSLRTLGTMIQSGVSMLEGVDLTASACGSLRYEKMWRDVNAKLEGGQQLSEALADRREIPRVVNKMLSAGERGGQLGPVMERVAIFCETELNTAVKTLTSLIEPAIVMFLGVVVGGLVLALLLPIFTISKAMH